MDIQDIKTLMHRGEFDEALIQIDQSDEHELDLIILKAIVLRGNEMFDASLNVALEALTKSREAKCKVHELGALIQVGYVYFIKQDIHQSQNNLSEFEELWNTLTDDQKERAKELEGYFYHIKGGLYDFQGEYEKAITNDEKSLKIREQLDDKYNIITNLNNLIMFYGHLGEYDTCFEYAQQQLAISKELGYGQHMAYAYVRIGEYYLIKGEYNQAREYFTKTLNISKEYNHRYIGAGAYERLARLSYHEGDHELALKNFTSSLTFYLDLNMDVYAGYNLYYLILVSLKMKANRLTDTYIQQLEKLSETSQNDRIKAYAKIARAIILKHNPRSAVKAEAQKLLEEIIEENQQYTITIDAMLHLSELLLDELKLYGNEEVLKEVDDLIRGMYEIAQQHRLFPEIINALVLRAKLSFLKLDLDESNKIIQQAHVLAEERGLNNLAIRVEQEEKKLEQEITMAAQISKHASSLLERLDKIKIIEYIRNAQNLIRLNP